MKKILPAGIIVAFVACVITIYAQSGSSNSTQSNYEVVTRRDVNTLVMEVKRQQS